jgi:hypothetical protein
MTVWVVTKELKGHRNPYYRLRQKEIVSDGGLADSDKLLPSFRGSRFQVGLVPRFLERYLKSETVVLFTISGSRDKKILTYLRLYAGP